MYHAPTAGARDDPRVGTRGRDKKIKSREETKGGEGLARRCKESKRKRARRVGCRNHREKPWRSNSVRKLRAGCRTEYKTKNVTVANSPL